MGTCNSTSVFLVFNYFFIVVLLDPANHVIKLFAYLGLSILTTFSMGFLAKSSLKRYRNVIKDIQICDDKSYQVTTIADQTIYIESGKCQVQDDTLVVNRNEKYEMKILTNNEIKFLLVPSWFGENE